MEKIWKSFNLLFLTVYSTELSKCLLVFNSLKVIWLELKLLLLTNVSNVAPNLLF